LKTSLRVGGRKRVEIEHLVAAMPSEVRKVYDLPEPA